MASLDSDREIDRLLRESIDELTRQLSPLGKLELATRLVGEAAIEGFEAIAGNSIRKPLDHMPRLGSQPVSIGRETDIQETEE